MEKEVGGLLLMILLLSGFAVASSFSEVNVTLFVSDGSESDVSFWDVYGNYVVVALVLLVAVVLWMKNSGSSRPRRGAKRKKKRKK
jgi:uncharacterized membrane protein YdbT with pleckstrin-like domain